MEQDKATVRQVDAIYKAIRWIASKTGEQLPWELNDTVIIPWLNNYLQRDLGINTLNQLTLQEASQILTQLNGNNKVLTRKIQS